MEVRGCVDGVTVYDDFAHHPTAIATTLAGLRGRIGNARILAVLEPRSNTMRMGVHARTLGPALSVADRVLLYQPADLGWKLDGVAAELGQKVSVFSDVAAIVDTLVGEVRTGDHVLIMSNGGFEGIHARLMEALRQRRASMSDTVST